MHGMYGTPDAELEVQRANKRAELTAFLCLFRKAIGLTMVHVDNKGIIDGLWSGEMRCAGPRAKDADLWIMIWEELHRVAFKKAHWWRSSTSKHTVLREGSAATVALSNKFITLKAVRMQMISQKGGRVWTEEMWRR